MAKSVFVAVYPLAVFWLFTLVTGTVELGSTKARALALVVGVCGMFFIRPPARMTRVTLLMLALSLALLGLLRAGQAYAAVAEGRTPSIDIATTTIESVHLQREGQNPYTTAIDPIGQQVDPSGTGFRFFGGFKYGPAMTWIYTPGVLARGASGFYITNFSLLMLAAAAAAAWASAAGSPAAVGAAVLLLSPSLWSGELFVGGSNDVAAVAMALVACAFRTGSPVVAGIAIGLSLGMKPFPALLYLTPLVLAGPSRFKFLLVAFSVTAASYLPALLRSPQELIAGLVVFNAARPPTDDSLLLYGAPDAVVHLASIMSILSGVGLAFLWDRRKLPWGPGNTALVCSCAVVLAFLGGRLLNANYLLWLFPMMAVTIAVRLWSSGQR